LESTRKTSCHGHIPTRAPFGQLLEYRQDAHVHRSP